MSSDEKIVSAIRIYRVFIDIKSMDIISIFFPDQQNFLSSKFWEKHFSFIHYNNCCYATIFSYIFILMLTLWIKIFLSLPCLLNVILFFLSDRFLCEISGKLLAKLNCVLLDETKETGMANFAFADDYHFTKAVIQGAL